MGVDKTKWIADKVGVDELGSRQSGMTHLQPFVMDSFLLDVYVYLLHRSALFARNFINCELLFIYTQ